MALRHANLLYSAKTGGVLPQTGEGERDRQCISIDERGVEGWSIRRGQY